MNRSIDASISHQRPQSLLFMALDDAMKSRLDGIRRSYQALTERLADPDVIANSNLLRQVMKDRSQSVDVVMAFDEYCRLETERQGAQELFQEAGDDAEMREMARSEMKSIESELDELETTIKILLLPKDPNDDRNCMLEIRAGTGGSEANIFAGKFKCCLGLRICDMRVCDMQYICTLFGNCS
jgi:peptide chain release factor 1